MTNTSIRHDFSRMVWVRLLNKSGQEMDRFEMRAGSNLWVFLRKRGHPIGSACSGVGVCGACHVTILTPHSTPGKVSPPLKITPQNQFERETLTRNLKPQEQRLACLCRVFSDVEVSAEYW